MTDPSLNIWLDPSGSTILLNVDVALAFDITLDENDVAINKVSSIDTDEVGTSNAQICSGINPDRRQGCVNPSTNPIATFELVLQYTASNKFFLLSFPFWPQEKEEGFLYLSCDIFILYSRVERILKKKKFSTRQVVPNC